LKNRLKLAILFFIIVIIDFPVLSQTLEHPQQTLTDTSGNTKDTGTAVRIISTDTSSVSILQKVSLQIESSEDADAVIEDYLSDLFPIISDKWITEIEASKEISSSIVNDSLGIYDSDVNFYVPRNFLDERPKILWELNIPAFESHLYQIYNKDTIYIDTWPNVVGKPSTKTFTGHYQAFRLRNWPYWKDPESPDSVRPTPPGPNNPLGLFVVHYDENSLRYFHGTNKNYLLKKEYRALSHGCVRNENANIVKMKKFIINKVIKNDDLSYWMGSKKSMTYEIKEDDKFPVRIIYRTFDIKNDDGGDYIIFYKDVYNYGGGEELSKFDDPSLITLTTTENVANELKTKYPSKQSTNDTLIPILDYLISNHKDYHKYYFGDLLSNGPGN
jgi:hypothetical protein